MLPASFSCWPWAPDSDARSAPARSTMLRTAVFIPLAPAPAPSASRSRSQVSSETRKRTWDREEWSLIWVAACARRCRA